MFSCGAHCSRDGIESLGNTIDLLRLVRIPAQVDIVCEILDSEHIDEDCSRDLEKDRDDDT